MQRLTLDDLRNLRDTERKTMAWREGLGETAVVTVGMGTAGIAAGAKDTMAALRGACEAAQLTGVRLRQSGEIGLDHAAPVVTVEMSGMPPAVYGRVDAVVAQRIVNEHIQGRQLVQDHLYDRPSADFTVERGS